MNLNNFHQKVNFFLLTLIIMMYPFSVKFCNALILVHAANWLVWIFREPQIFNFKNRAIWILLLPFLIVDISLIYSADVKSGWFVIEKKIPMLLLPLTLGTVSSITQEQVEKIMSTACIAAVMSLVFCTSLATYRFWYNLPGGFFWKDLTNPVDFHPSYFSLYINFLIVWLGYQLFIKWDSSTRQKKILQCACIIFFYGSLVMLASKIQLIIAALIFILQLVQLSKIFDYKFILSFAICLVLIFSFFFKKSYLEERFLHINTMTYKLDDPVDNFNEFTIRLALLECSWMIIEQNPVLGVGVGDVNAELDKIYRKVDYKFGYLDQQNPHNQYLSQLLATGCIGLLALLLLLIFSLTKAITNKNIPHLLFLIFFILSFFFESILERQKGIVLFSLFNTLFLFHWKLTPKSFGFNA